MTEERRERGQVVNLTEGEHLRSAFWVIITGLLVGGIFSMTEVWSQTAINAKDIQRHEMQLLNVGEKLDRIESKVDELIGALHK